MDRNIILYLLNAYIPMILLHCKLIIFEIARMVVLLC